MEHLHGFTCEQPIMLVTMTSRSSGWRRHREFRLTVTYTGKIGTMWECNNKLIFQCWMTKWRQILQALQLLSLKCIHAVITLTVTILYSICKPWRWSSLVFALLAGLLYRTIFLWYICLIRENKYPLILPEISLDDKVMCSLPLLTVISYIVLSYLSVLQITFPTLALPEIQVTCSFL